MKEIQMTKDYSLFKFIDGNRALDYKHINHLKQSIGRWDLTQLNPIIVNDEFEIVDWQHRFYALKQMGKPIYYIIWDWLNAETAQLINSASKTWCLKDYLKSYIEWGRIDYIMLWSFLYDYKIPISVAINILSDNPQRNSWKELKHIIKFKMWEMKIRPKRLEKMREL